MPVIILTEEQLDTYTQDLDLRSLALVRGWLKRGDGVAVYQNMALDSINRGHRMFCSFGSPQAQIEAHEPPFQMPDLGQSTPWAYRLEAMLKGNQ